MPQLNHQSLLFKIQTQNLGFTIPWARVRLGLKPLVLVESTNCTRAAWARALRLSRWIKIEWPITIGPFASEQYPSVISPSISDRAAHIDWAVRE